MGSEFSGSPKGRGAPGLLSVRSASHTPPAAFHSSAAACYISAVDKSIPALSLTSPVHMASSHELAGGRQRCECAGAVEPLEDGSSRAHLQRRDESGRKVHIRGPRRGEKRKSEEDLQALRAAAQEIAPPAAWDPAAAWDAMAAEARRLQGQAEFEGRVAAYVSVYSSKAKPGLPPAVESQSLDMTDTEPYESQDDYNDGNDPWQEIDDEGRMPGYQPPPLIPVPDPKNAVEATGLLAKFRPARMSTADLKKLLGAQADPNIRLTSDLHPLIKVMTFAHADHVGPMRELLLQSGAVESAAAKEQWAIRRRADACEEAWMRNFHRDPR